MSHSTADEFVWKTIYPVWIFQEEGEEAVMKELQQMHDLKVVKRMEVSTIKPEMRKKVLSYLMFLKRKKLETVKGRGCADGRKHNKSLKKEDAASPTVSIPALMISTIQDAIEEVFAVTLDILGAILQTDQPDLMKLSSASREKWENG